ncbi:hypothetical protein BH10CYA1_BH10CYA1_11230 [soil metagenome]
MKGNPTITSLEGFVMAVGAFAIIRGDVGRLNSICDRCVPFHWQRATVQSAAAAPSLLPANLYSSCHITGKR